MGKKKTEEQVPEEEKTEKAEAETADKAEEKSEAKPEAEAAPDKKASPADEVKAANDKYLRLLAEYDNYKKRSAKEREAIYTDVRADTISKLLPVYDNLERAMATETADAAFKKGVEMTFNQLTDVFKKLGIEVIEAKGKTFDPNLHNAVMHVDDESFGESEIVEEFQKGFKVGDKVIRHSMVKVAN